MRRALPVLAVLALVAGCSGEGADEDGGTLTVLAAASLTDVFDRLAERFREEHPGVDLRISYGGSDGLAVAITQGAPADVFASAAEEQMAVVTGAGLAAEPETFAGNVLTIAVPEGNPAGITGLADLAREELTLAVCAPEVPCGAAAGELLEVAGVQARPDTYEEDVRAALNKVGLGEVDAALVYATDVAARPDRVDGVEVPEADSVVNDYPVAVLDDAPNPAAARAFVDLLLSDEGREVLARAGFRAP
ncbi:molybdate ABC transporter substrate-binding protein [Blastococcus capsensis]|uniref:molybdate ABC transporter substrate-binding protein n=1 Tax=Blastococcus capsensis TaxID=1564163 RepID=UPI002542104F|nr:molybdate ABC transporter substrate-binding protein [Blastococcus capsensis]MDK3255287.1 molybdate ABC transporter substrate-binding protein [Blastococcus capsensis]